MRVFFCMGRQKLKVSPFYLNLRYTYQTVSIWDINCEWNNVNNVKTHSIQEQADKWVRSRKRSPLPFIFVVPPSKDRSDPDHWFLIIDSWSLIPDPWSFTLSLSLSFAQQGQVRYCCTFVIWTKINISIIWILSGADGLTWCEKCGRKHKKSKPTILYNRSLTVSQSQYCIYNLKEKKFFFRSFWSASTETTNLLDIPKSLNLLKLKSHICYKSIQYPWTSLWENCINIGSLSIVEPYMIPLTPKIKWWGIVSTMQCTST